MMTARWKVLTPSQFEHERRALDFVRAGLPDHEPYRAWANFEFTAADGALYEVDLLVLAPKVKVFNWQVGVRSSETTSGGTTHVSDLIDDQSRVYLAPEALFGPRQVTQAAGHPRRRPPGRPAPSAAPASCPRSARPRRLETGVAVEVGQPLHPAAAVQRQPSDVDVVVPLLPHAALAVGADAGGLAAGEGALRLVLLAGGVGVVGQLLGAPAHAAHLRALFALVAAHDLSRLACRSGLLPGARPAAR